MNKASVSNEITITQQELDEIIEQVEKARSVTLEEADKLLEDISTSLSYFGQRGRK